MKNMIRLIKEVVGRYMWQIIIGIILIASIVICYKFIAKPIDNPSTYLISIVLGFIAFSIPFLWNAYQRILDKKAHIQGDKIENILTKEFYLKSLRYFEILIQYPVGILIFLGLFVVPLFPFYLGVTALVIIFFYFSMLPQIFQKVEVLSTTNLKDFLTSANAESEDTRKVFAELWQKEDDLFEKEFSIELSHIFECFANKVGSLIEQNKPLLIQPLLEDFNGFLSNRLIISLTVCEEVHSKIFKWYFEICKRESECSNKADWEREWIAYNSILRNLNSIIKNIEEQALKGNMPFFFFECFKKHVEEYKKEKIEDKNRKTRHYIESLFRTFYQVFFENIKDAPEKYDIWEYYFPTEWKITKANLENKDNYVSQISLDRFLRLASSRMQQPMEGFDGILDGAIKNLFPEIDPIVWSRILLFIYTPYDSGCRVKSVIEREWNFGFSGRGYVSFVGDKKEFEKEFKEHGQQQERNAFELALFLFVKQFEKENLKKYIEELKALESEYKDGSMEEGHRLRLLYILDKMLDLPDSKS